MDKFEATRKKLERIEYLSQRTTTMAAEHFRIKCENLNRRNAREANAKILSELGKINI